MDLCDLSCHHVVYKKVLSLSGQNHLLPITAEVGCGDRKTLNVHTLKFRIHLTVNLNKIVQVVTEYSLLNLLEGKGYPTFRASGTGEHW